MLKRESLLIHTQFRQANPICHYLVYIREVNLILYFTQKANSESHDYL